MKKYKHYFICIYACMSASANRGCIGLWSELDYFIRTADDVRAKGTPSQKKSFFAWTRGIPPTPRPFNITWGVPLRNKILDSRMHKGETSQTVSQQGISSSVSVRVCTSLWSLFSLTFHVHTKMPHNTDYKHIRNSISIFLTNLSFLKKVKAHLGILLVIVLLGANPPTDQMVPHGVGQSEVVVTRGGHIPVLDQREM